MEPTAPSLTEEDLTEVKKDVSSITWSRCRRGPGVEGGAGAGCGPAGKESGNPEWESESEKSLRVREAEGPDTAGLLGALHPRALVEVIPRDLLIYVLNR